MGNLLEKWVSVLLVCVCLFACSDKEEQNDEEVQKRLLVGFWKAQTTQGNTDDEYNVCYDIRQNGTFTVYDYDTETGWYNDGEGVWKYDDGNLLMTYTDQLDIFKVQSVTENELILIDTDEKGGIAVTYQRVDAQDVIVTHPKRSPVGTWMCNKCVVVEKKCDDFPEINVGKTWGGEEGGVIVFNSNHTGSWDIDDEQTSFTWRFDSDVIYATVQGQEEIRVSALYSDNEFCMPVNDWACGDHITDVYWRYYKRIE